jgi:hypothetical protein
MTNIQNSIQLYKAEYLKENDYKKTIVDGQRITMQFVVFGDMTCLFIRLYNEEDIQIGTYSFNCANTQTVEVKRSKLACTVSNKDAKQFDHLVNLPRWQFEMKHSKQIELEDLIDQSKKKEGVK